jgi:hypothetical protein
MRDSTCVRLRELLLCVCGVGCRLGFEPRTAPDGASDAEERDAPGDDAAGEDAAIDAPIQVCTGYVAWTGLASTYRVVTSSAPWLTAEAACESDGAHLIVVDTAVENDALVANASGNTWIGGSDRITEGTFLVVTGGGTPYANWPVGVPMNVSEDCVEVLSSGSWEDGDCDAGFDYVCECDGMPVVAGTF